MRRKKTIPGRKNEQGIIIALVAVFMLFVIGAMAALSIDVVTMYTARSEAQLAADGAALAGARVLANSGMTSDATLTASAETIASTVATQVAMGNSVGGNAPTVVTVTFNGGTTDPHVTVTVQRTDLPTFFARVWGRTQVTVGASATAEAYNPSGTNALGETTIPVAPICVKPWLLPNIDPTQTVATVKIFSPSGAINNPGLVGQTWPNATVANANPNGLYAVCGGDCGTYLSTHADLPYPNQPGVYYPGAIDATDFPAPTQALPACSLGFTIPYQLAVAGCVQRPISCGVNSAINPSAIKIDTNIYISSTGSRDSDTVQAAGCLIHYNVSGGAPGDSDSINLTATPTPPFDFLGGNQNPVAGAVGKDVLVSDSLVTIPVIDSNPFVYPSNPSYVIGFLQVFLNPQQSVLPFPLPALPPNQIPAMIINMVGCGNPTTGATGPPILGNGASPVAVRLISPP